MPSAPLRKQVPKDRFATLFTTLKTQTYYDPASRGPGSHTIRTIAWNPTGHLIATGSQDKTLRIWNPEKPQVKNSTELRGHTGAIEKVAWNPTKEAELASVSTDGTVKFWDVRNKGCIETVQLGARGLSLSWSSEGDVVMVGRGERAEDESLLPISVPSFTPHASLPQHTQTNTTAFCPHIPGSKEHTLFITTGNGTVKVATYPIDPPPTETTTTTTTINTNDNPSLQEPTPDALTDTLTDNPLPTSSPLKTIYSFPAHTSSCTTLQLSPNGRYLATGGSDAMVGLWDTWEWVCKRTLDQYVGTVRQVSFSFDGSYLAAGSEEAEELEVAHVESGEVVAAIGLQGASSGVVRAVTGGAVMGGLGASVGSGSNAATCVAWHPHRYWLAYSGEPGGLRVVGAGGGVL